MSTQEPTKQVSDNDKLNAVINQMINLMIARWAVTAEAFSQQNSIDVNTTLHETVKQICMEAARAEVENMLLAHINMAKLVGINFDINNLNQAGVTMH